MIEDLIERLRAQDKPVCKEAACEIERLHTKLKKAEMLIDAAEDEIEFMRNAANENAKRAEAAEKWLTEKGERIAAMSAALEANEKGASSG
ncbi:hypothetical protein [Nitratireductor basaltis]|uniref:Uncharacterized protein n=1 Tax=Nitratireductor basaltis TaxID=472175 RepID=A0A084UDP3_9HYPH|nr:hypothetical protein [Nitratireductor basaltis]KFB11079.1 hypothetical protein EL18_02121 [Nitratireductor basaltis]